MSNAEKQTVSWILLATALASENNFANRNKILLAADAINCAIPTNKEFENAIKLLVEKKLVFIVDDENYMLTESGKKLIGKASLKTKVLFQIKENLESLMEL